MFQLIFLFLTVFHAHADSCDFVRQQIQTDKAVVTVPDGIYICDAPIIINKNGVQIAAANKGKAIFKLADNANCPLIVVGDAKMTPVDGIQISGLVLDGNRTNQKDECWGGPCDKPGHPDIRNNGITVRAASNIEIQDVDIHSMRSGGIVTERKCSHLHVNHLSSTDNYFDGFAGYQTTDSVFENLDLSKNHAAGISLDLGFDANTFRNVTIDNDHDVGIFMRDSSGNLFDTLAISNTGSHGAFVSVSEAGAPSCPLNNIFQDMSFDNINGDGFILNGSCAGNQLIRAKFNKIRGKNINESIPGTLTVQ